MCGDVTDRTHTNVLTATIYRKVKKNMLPREKNKGMLKMTEKLSRKMSIVPYVGIYHRKLIKLDFTPSQMLENVPIKWPSRKISEI